MSNPILSYGDNLYEMSIPIFSYGDNLHEMSIPIFGKNKKINLSSAEFAPRVETVK